jgi:hypothetical protein
VRGLISSANYCRENNAGADVTIKNNSDETALHAAAFGGDAKIAQLVIERGVLHLFISLYFAYASREQGSVAIWE